METESPSKHCYRCRRFTQYYVVGEKRFNKTKCGLCTEKGEIVGLHETCDKHEKKPYIRRSRYGLKGALNSILVELTEIRTVLEREENE